MGKGKTFWGISVFLLTIFLIQLLTTVAGRSYYLTQLTMSAYYTVVVLGLCLVMGYAGQISLGHGAFFALGGYTSAVLTTNNFEKIANLDIGRLLLKAGVLVQREDIYGETFIAFSAWSGFLCAIILTILVALLIGYPTLRLRGHYLAMGTLAFGLIVYRIILGSEFTNGADGIASVPSWTIIPGLTVSGNQGRISNYYIACGLLVLVLVFIMNLVNSRTGRALRSIHGGEAAANAMGINTAGYKLKVFILSAVFAAIAGSFLAHYNGGIGPSEAGIMRSARYVALVAAGGMASVWGVLIVGFVLTFLSLRGVFGTLDHAVFGSLLILIMWFVPEGPLVPLKQLLHALLKRLKRSWQSPKSEQEAKGVS